MSRGPGIWQRAILAALDKHDALHPVDLLPDALFYRPYCLGQCRASGAQAGHRSRWVVALGGRTRESSIL